MTIKAAELQVVIGADVNPALQGIRGAMGQIEQAGTTALGVFTGQVLFGAMQQVGQAFVGLGQSALQSTVGWEQLQYSLEALTANELRTKDSTLSLTDALTAASGPAAEILKWVQEQAIRSPFPTETVAQVFQMQMRMGATSEQAQILSKALLDMGAATGLTSENLAGAGLALAQIGGSSQLSAQDLRQLINAGIPVNDVLKKMGLSWDDLGKKSVSGQEFIEAFINKAGDYAGSIDRTKGSWSAMLGALQDAKDIGLKELFSGVFDALQPIVQQFADWMLGPGMEKLQELGANLGEITTKFIDIGKAFVDAGPFSQQFSDSLSALSPTLGDLWAQIAPFIQQGLQWISDNKDAIIAALTGMAVAFGALTVIGAVAGFVSMLANPLTLIIALAGLLGVAWQQNWGGIQEKVAAVWAWLQPILVQIIDWFETNIPIALQTLQTSWATTWTEIQNVIGIIQGVWDGLMTFISDLTSGKLGWLSTVWMTTVEFIQATIQNGVTIIQSIFAAFSAALEGDWYAFGQQLRIVWDAVWKQIGEALTTAWTNLSIVIGTLVENIINFFSNKDWGEVGENIILGIADGIKASLTWLINAAQEAAKAALDATKGFLGIQSPSRVFEKEVGWQMGAGIQEGLLRSIQTLTMSMPRIMSPVIAAGSNVSPVSPGTVQNVGNERATGGLVIQNLQIAFQDTSLTPETFGNALQQLEWMYT